MRITLEKYNPAWPAQFQNIKKEITQTLGFLHPVIEHIGSTAVPGLSAKPVIDILVGLKNPVDIDAVITPLIRTGYIYYEKYNEEMPYRRFFARLKTTPEALVIPRIYYNNDEVPLELNHYKLAHIHVLTYNTYHGKDMFFSGTI